MTTSLRELLKEIAAQAKPVELAGPALRRARRIRTRRYMVGAVIGVVAVLGLSFGLGSRADRGGPQFAPPSSASPTPSVFAVPSIPSRPVPRIQGTPDELPGGWIMGGGQGADQPWIYDRVQGRYRTVPYSRAIPAPVGELVFVENQDGWAAALNLRTGHVRRLASAGSGWTLGLPEWSSDGRRLLRITEQGRLYVTNADTGASQEIVPEGGACELCNSVVWMPGENEVALFDSNNPNGQTGVYAVASGKRLRTVPWKPGAGTAFSPDGTRVFTRDGIVEVTTGRLIVPVLGVDDERTVYWAKADGILVIEHGGVKVLTDLGSKVDFFPWPAEFADDELPNFSLVKVSG